MARKFIMKIAAVKKQIWPNVLSFIVFINFKSIL